MGYKVKWVEDNLGVSRKALRLFEKEGLLPENKNRQYRDYDEETIDRIWKIRVLQGMGYTMKEIAAMISDEDFDFYHSLGEKIGQLEQKKAELERHLGYAKTIKLTGRFPSRPKEMGAVKFQEFHENSLNAWNINCDQQTKQTQMVVDMMLTKPQEEWQETDLGQVLKFLSLSSLNESEIEVAVCDMYISKAIIKRMALGADNSEVQLLVRIIYDNLRENWPELKNLPPKQFARFYSSNYIVGDMARLNEKKYGKEGCLFIADAIAVFGGYSGADDPELD